MAFSRGSSPQHNQIPWRIVTVDIVEGDSIHCIDSSGVPVIVDARVARAKGARPVVGERWILDRSVLDQWTFAAVLDPSPPEVIGSHSTGTAGFNLIQTLATMGLIRDGTVGSPGGGPGGGGGLSSTVNLQSSVPISGGISTDYVLTIPTGATTAIINTYANLDNPGVSTAWAYLRGVPDNPIVTPTFGYSFARVAATHIWIPAFGPTMTFRSGWQGTDGGYLGGGTVSYTSLVLWS